MQAWSVIHRWSSLACTAFLLMLCLTGLPLIFHDEIDAASGRLVHPPAGEHGPELPLDRIADRADGAVQAIYWKDEEPRVVHLVTTKAGDTACDARTALPLRTPTAGPDVMGGVLMLHSRLFAGLAGYIALGLAGLLAVLAILSGVVLYAPFTRHLRFGEIRRSRPLRVRMLDHHNLLGIATAAWLAVVAVTGTINTLEEPLFAVWRADRRPDGIAAAQGKSVTPGQALAAARRAAPALIPNSMVLPTSPVGTPGDVTVWMHGGSPLTERLYRPVMVDVRSGRAELDRNFPWYLNALNLARPLHFGDYGGLPLKIIWALLDIVTIVVLATGLFLWFGKCRPRRLG
ncbi:putative iron-regulated membrane protein [Novosphingobium sp. PhB165]|uniref:PepSY-associated TM helix domain-containing protein n=1 Tax=Novosphingobium sp. PhB165 TaxID=2485105 RepID=UPI001046804F|nr:PepSY-associated TM helix domain-containing protein [Novosphingobium sp. PhB165]TCM20397.1 putative iron-regulated membrane protein [Novosphingobium sp. PhB165]